MFRRTRIKIAKKFYQDLNIEAPLKDITLTGSSANYNWTDYSDIDLHLLIFLIITKSVKTGDKNSWWVILQKFKCMTTVNTMMEVQVTALMELKFRGI